MITTTRIQMTTEQEETLQALHDAGESGLTWFELAEILDVHHGVASGLLSVLHKREAITRLAGERRNKCKVYVSLDHVAGRSTEKQGVKRLHIEEEIRLNDLLQHRWKAQTVSGSEFLLDLVQRLAK